MIHEIILPMLGETMDDGQITAWHKAEGDKVTKGEPLFEVTTDKAAFEAESPADGYLRKILFQVSEQAIPVAKVIGYIADSMDEPLPQTSDDKSTKPALRGFTCHNPGIPRCSDQPHNRLTLCNRKAQQVHVRGVTATMIGRFLQRFGRQCIGQNRRDLCPGQQLQRLPEQPSGNHVGLIAQPLVAVPVHR